MKAGAGGAHASIKTETRQGRLAQVLARVWFKKNRQKTPFGSPATMAAAIEAVVAPVTAPYCPTGQQKTVFAHDGSAFVTACPGAGKTRTMVERARHLADRTDDKRGVAFSVLHNAAVDELQSRLTPVRPAAIAAVSELHRYI